MKNRFFLLGIAVSSIAALAGCAGPAESAGPAPTVTVTSTVTVTAPAPAVSGQGSMTATTTTMSSADNLTDVIRNLISGDKVSALKKMTPEFAKFNESRTPSAILLGNGKITGCQLGEKVVLDPSYDYRGSLSIDGPGFEAVSWKVICPDASYQILAGTLGPDHKIAAMRT